MPQEERAIQYTVVLRLCIYDHEYEQRDVAIGYMLIEKRHKQWQKELSVGED